MTFLAKTKGAMGQKQAKAEKTRRKAIPRQSDKAKATPRHLRQNAEGMPCTLRLPGCRDDRATVVLCHYRRFNWGGMGEKPIDVLGCFACHHCHLMQEAHHPDATDTDLLRAMGETFIIQWTSGIIGYLAQAPEAPDAR